MKPIVRWTIGEVSYEGVLCLEASICNFINLYKNQFRYFLCYNNINLKDLKFLNKFDLNLIKQNKKEEIEYEFNDLNEPFWKLIPFRIDKNVHEIFIDNDLVIYEKIEEIEEFLNSQNKIICSESLKRCYGSLQNEVKEETYINTGFFGLPPHFEFENKINYIIKKFDLNNARNVFNEQGCLAYIFEKENLKIINKEKISICFEKVIKGKKGMHFVGINRLDNGVYYEQIPFLEERTKIIQDFIILGKIKY